MLKKITDKAQKYSVKQNKKVKRFNGLRAIIPGGKYSGREGVIKCTHIDRFGMVVGLIPPYSQRKSEVLDSHRDTWKYWILTDEILITKPKTGFFQRWFK